MTSRGIPTDLDKIAKMFGLPDPESVDESSVDYVAEAGSYAYKEALEGGEDEDKAEEAREEAEQAAQDEIYRKWHGGITSVAEELFGAHKLELVPRRKGERYPFEYYIVPTETWREAAEALRETVNGTGPFWFRDLKEFLEEGPYTVKQAVENRLGWIRHYPEVYGTSSVSRIYESAWR